MTVLKEIKIRAITTQNEQKKFDYLTRVGKSVLGSKSSKNNSGDVVAKVRPKTEST